MTRVAGQEQAHVLLFVEFVPRVVQGNDHIFGVHSAVELQPLAGEHIFKGVHGFHVTRESNQGFDGNHLSKTLVANFGIECKASVVLNVTHRFNLFVSVDNDAIQEEFLLLPFLVDVFIEGLAANLVPTVDLQMGFVNVVHLALASGQNASAVDFINVSLGPYGQLPIG